MRIALLNGHPDPSPERYSAALAAAYATGAAHAGHTVSRIDVGALDLAFLRNAAEFQTPPGDEVAAERQKIASAEHVVIIYPLWLGTMPACLKAFLEQAGRGDFFLAPAPEGARWPARKMKGKSARVIVTMGMPGVAYRFLMGAHSLKSMEGMILSMSGFKPVRSTVIGSVESGAAYRASMLQKVEALGRKAL